MPDWFCPVFAFQLLPKQLKTCRPNASSISGKWDNPGIGRFEAKMVRKFKKILGKSIEGLVCWWLLNPVGQIHSPAMQVPLLLVCSTDWEWSF